MASFDLSGIILGAACLVRRRLSTDPLRTRRCTSTRSRVRWLDGHFSRRGMGRCKWGFDSPDRAHGELLRHALLSRSCTLVHDDFLRLGLVGDPIFEAAFAELDPIDQRDYLDMGFLHTAASRQLLVWPLCKCAVAPCLCPLAVAQRTRPAYLACHGKSQEKDIGPMQCGAGGP